MDLTRSTVERAAREYRETAPLHTVEREQIETLPAAFAAGEYGWRDAVWVVRWYYRRFLGTYPDAARRDAEARFEGNDFETIRGAIADVAGSNADPGEISAQVDRLTDLDGVDAAVASAFLAFVHPDDAIVVGPRCWSSLRRADELDAPYPDPPSVDDYREYLIGCRTVADRVDCDLWTLYRALWRRSGDSSSG